MGVLRASCSLCPRGPLYYSGQRLWLTRWCFTAPRSSVSLPPASEFPWAPEPRLACDLALLVCTVTILIKNAFIFVQQV